MVGTPNSQTMRVIGILRWEQVVVLVDLGSTNSFMDPYIAHNRRLPIVESGAIYVNIANSDIVQGEGQCNNAPIKLQGTQFNLSFYLPKLCGCNIVLGMTWLQILRLIIWNFSKLIMEYGDSAERIILKGLTLEGLTLEDNGNSLLHSMHCGKGLCLQLQEIQDPDMNLKTP